MAEETQETKKDGYGKRPMWQWVLIYLIIGALVYGAFYYFVAKKSSYNSTYNQSSTQDQNKPTAVTSPSQAATANEMTVTLASVNNSSQSGTATLKEENGKTTVTVNLTGYKNGVSQPAHIHVGACPGVGAVKYPLTNIVNGASTTVLPVTLAQLKKELPLALNIHKSAAEVKVYTACGPLK